MIRSTLSLSCVILLASLSWGQAVCMTTEEMDCQEMTYDELSCYRFDCEVEDYSVVVIDGEEYPDEPIYGTTCSEEGSSEFALDATITVMTEVWSGSQSGYLSYSVNNNSLTYCMGGHECADCGDFGGDKCSAINGAFSEWDAHPAISGNDPCSIAEEDPYDSYGEDSYEDEYYDNYDETYEYDEYYGSYPDGYYGY